MVSRRKVLGLGVGMVGAAMVWPAGAQEDEDGLARAMGPMPEAIARLPKFVGRVAPFTNEERMARMEKARELMGRLGMGAMVLAGGSKNPQYFAGVKLGESERLWALVIPAKGQVFFVCPAFERERAGEMLEGGPIAGAEVMTWQENESPFELVVKGLAARGVKGGQVGLDEAMMFVFARELMKAAPAIEFVSATPVTGGCRIVKDAHELQCIKTAGAATLAVYEAVYRSVKPGMMTGDVVKLVQMGYAQVGLRGEASLNIDEFTASPHGSRKPQTIKEGSLLMLDDGCEVEGYTADITRTFCLGKPTDKQRKVFEIVKAAQTAAMKFARPGVAVGDVDKAARAVITDAGYGPGYAHFTHRVGHGIGLDMHEWPYLSENNMFLDERRPLLVAGMTFSDEPGVYIKGEFGVRLEDELHITSNGAELLTPQSVSLDEPFGRA